MRRYPNFAATMKRTKTYFYQPAIWLGILVIILFLGSPIGRPPGFYLIATLRVFWLAIWFNLAYYVLLPLYFSGRKKAFFIWSPGCFLAFVGLSVFLDEIAGLTGIIRKTMLQSPGFQATDAVWVSFMPPFFLGLIVFGVAASLAGFSAYEKKKRDEEVANARSLEAELALLKSQINPHFLLNTLNNLYALAITVPEKTPEALLKLSDMVAYILHECNKPKISLARDLRFIENYVDLQRLRLPPNVALNMELSGDPANLVIEPMVLIPFIENAFKHGLTTKQPCEIFISIKNDHQQLVLKVENLVLPVKLTQHGNESGIGLANTRQRLEHTYPDRHLLYISNNGNKHTVELTILMDDRIKNL